MKNYLTNVFIRCREKVDLLNREGCKALLRVRRNILNQTRCFIRAIGEFGRRIVEHREMLGYYAVLTLVLIALAAGAHDYRNGSTSEGGKVNPQTYDPGVAVQMQPDPTMEPLAETAKEFMLPVQGKNVGEFTNDELAWSATLQLWQTHPAVDIAANAGEAVVAAADGTVVEAYRDALYGNIIAIDHGDNCTIRYASLNTLQLVEVGQRVQKGDVISSVGTCIAESELGAHIHVECDMNRRAVDFLSLIAEEDLSTLQD